MTQESQGNEQLIEDLAEDTWKVLAPDFHGTPIASEWRIKTLIEAIMRALVKRFHTEPESASGESASELELEQLVKVLREENARLTRVVDELKKVNDEQLRRLVNGGK